MIRSTKRAAIAASTVVPHTPSSTPGRVDVRAITQAARKVSPTIAAIPTTWAIQIVFASWPDVGVNRHGKGPASWLTSRKASASSTSATTCSRNHWLPKAPIARTGAAVAASAAAMGCLLPTEAT